MPARILVIEDNPVNRYILTESLQALGHACLTASDGSEGVELARRELPDLILMDLLMPVMDGFQATAAIKSDDALRHIPIVAVTALATSADRQRALAAGCDGYVIKPLTIQKIVREAEIFLPPDKRSADSGAAPE
jgi:two-component system cell cycle response regulator DivK